MLLRIGCCLGLAVVACGSASPSASSSTPSPSAAAATSSTAATPSLPPTAASLVTGLAAQIATVTASVVYTAATDPNHLLGRPGGYTSKAAFTDSRISASQAQDPSAGSVDLGGSIEVFPGAAGAVARGQYIERAEAATGILAHEYDITSGGVLLRLSAVFTPTQVQPFQAALSHITGQPANPVPTS
jgi:hypothetical protein